MFSPKIASIFSLLGIVLLIRFFLVFSSIHSYSDSEPVSLTTTIQNQPKVNGKIQSFSITPENREALMVVVGAYPALYYGQKVHIEGRVQKKALANKKIITQLFFPKIQVVPQKNEFVFTKLPIALAHSFQERVSHLYQETLPSEYASLMLGIVFGMKENFSKSFVQELKSAGVMHVIAASGMNVTLVAGFFIALFSAFFKRQVAIFLTIFAILFYALIAGFQASIIRAAFMGSLAFFAQLFGRQYQGSYGLPLAAFVMLFVNPGLISDIGFQLSFLATLGLLTINPLFNVSFFKRFSKLIIWEDLVTTISAQAATLPLLLSFGSYSLWAVVVNALVLWTIPILMILGGAAALIGFVFQPLAQLLLYLCLPFLYYFESLVSFFGGLTSTKQTIEVPIAFTIGYYLLLGSLVCMLYRKRE